MALWKRSGTFLWITGIIHCVVGVAIDWDALAAIMGEGFFNAVLPHYDRFAIIWFMLWGFLLIMLGLLASSYMKANGRQLPRSLGWQVLAMGMGGVLLFPISGMWLLIPQGWLIAHGAGKGRASRR